jgi:CRP-like cAMP-binding protein
MVVTALQLKAFFVFSEMNRVDLDFLGTQSSIRRFAPGEYIFEEGQLSNDLYLLVQGRVKVQKTVENQTIDVAQLEPGALFGETAFLEQGIHSASIQAIEATALVVIPMAAIDNRIAANPQFGHLFYKALCIALSKRMRSTNSRLTAMMNEKDDKAIAAAFSIPGNSSTKKVS